MENWPPIVEIHLILIPIKPGSVMLICPMLVAGTLASLQTAQTHLCIAKTSPKMPQSMLRWWSQAQTPLSLQLSTSYPWQLPEDFIAPERRRQKGAPFTQPPPGKAKQPHSQGQRRGLVSSALTFPGTGISLISLPSSLPSRKALPPLPSTLQALIPVISCQRLWEGMCSKIQCIEGGKRKGKGSTGRL